MKSRDRSRATKDGAEDQMMLQPLRIVRLMKRDWSVTDLGGGDVGGGDRALISASLRPSTASTTLTTLVAALACGRPRLTAVGAVQARENRAGSGGEPFSTDADVR